MAAGRPTGDADLVAPVGALHNRRPFSSRLLCRSVVYCAADRELNHIPRPVVVQRQPEQVGVQPPLVDGGDEAADVVADELGQNLNTISSSPTGELGSGTSHLRHSRREVRF